MSAPIPDARSAEHWFQEAWDPEMSLGDWWQVLALSGWGFPTWPERWFGRGLDSQEARRVQAALAASAARLRASVAQRPAIVVLKRMASPSVLYVVLQVPIAGTLQAA